ncbi:MMPL family transporter [Algiphilus sp.]|uniref:efflux RND transporter permease subunit n=3 Tax=Algiphilus sp. TaxID=1872431 RepID=UPI0025B9E1D6|nr:MMPL family transporter [Algiphilus sp.]MCK5770374.1 MMPL family transporter [Algiphilus sp.]
MLVAARERLVAWRGAAAIVAVALAGLAAAGVQHLSFTTDYRAFFSEDNPDLAQLEFIEENFARAETLVITIAPDSGDVFDAHALEAVRWLSGEVLRLPYSKGVSSITEYYPARGREGELVVEPLIPDRPLDDDERARIRADALADDRITGIMLARDGAATGLIAHFELPHEEPEVEIQAVADAARAMMADFRTRPFSDGIETHLAGVMMLNDAMSGVLMGEAFALYPLVFLVMFVLLALLLRSLAATAVTVAVIVMSAGAAMGAAGWLGITLTSPSLTAGLVVMTLAVADCVHMLTTMGLRAQAGDTPRDALLHSIRVNFLPILLTSVTTAIGFLGLNLSDSPPYRDLGNLVAIGVMAALAFSMMVLPWWCMRFPVRRPPVTRGMHRALVALADTVTRRRRMLLTLGAVVVVAALAALPQNRFGDNYVHFFESDHPFREATEFTNAELTGMQYVEYVFDAGGDGAAMEPAFLRDMHAYAEWLRTQPEVRKVSSVVGVLQSLNQAMHDGDPAFHRLPESRPEAAQYLLLYELSLPSGVDLTHLVNIHKSAARMTVQLDTISSEAIRQFDERAVAWQRRHFDHAAVARGAGVSIMFAHIARRNFVSMLWGTGIAFGVISLLLLAAFRSPRLAAISLAPNLLPAIIGFGIWGVTVGQVGLSLAVVGSLTLGIIVDDTLHMLNRYARARRAGADAEAAVREALTQVGPALVITSLVLFVGFALFTTSGFLLTVHFGALTAIVIAAALLADFFLLPPLLLWLDRR